MTSPIQPPRKWLWQAALELLLFAFTCAMAAFCLLAASPAGTRLLFRTLPLLSGGVVSVARVEGTLWGNLSVHDLRVVVPSTTVQLDQATLQWQPGYLLAGRLVVQQLTLGQLDLQTRSTGEPFVLPKAIHLPIPMQVNLLTLRRLTVDGVTISNAARLAIHSDGRLHQLTLLRAEGDYYAASGQATLNGNAPFKVEGDIALAGRADGLPWQGKVNLANRLDLLRLSGTASGAPAGIKPFRANFDLGIRPFASTNYGLLASGYLSTDGLNLRQLSPRLPQTALDIRLSAKPEGEAVRASLSVSNTLAGHWPQNRLPLSQLDVSSLLTADSAQLQQFVAKLAGGTLRASGRVSKPKIDVSVQLSAMDPKAFGGPAWPMAGTLVLHGSTAQPTLDATIITQQLALAVSASLGGKSDQRILNFSKLTLSGGQGDLQLKGQLALSGKQGFALQGEGRHFNPALLSAWLGHEVAQGDVNVALQSSGQLATPRSAKLSLDLQASRFNGQPLQGRLAGDWRGQQVQHVVADLTLGTNHLTATGGFGLPGDRLQLALQLPHIEDLGPGFQGRLAAQLAASGGWARPILEGTAQGDDLRLPGKVMLNHAQLQAKLDASPAHPANSPLALYLQVDGLTAPSLAMAAGHLVLTGTQAAHTVELTGSGRTAGKPFDLQLKGGGALDTQGWRGQIDMLENRGEWPVRLSQPAQLALGLNRASLTNLDATAIGARIRVQKADWQDGRFNAVGDVRDFAVRDWLVRLPTLQQRSVTDLVLAGRFDLHGDRQLTGSLVVERVAGDLALVADETGMRPMPLKLSAASTQLDLAGDKVSLALTVKSDAFGSLQGGLSTRFVRTVEGWQPLPGTPIEARLHADMPALNWIGPLLGPTAKVEGKLSADLVARGVADKLATAGESSDKSIAMQVLDQLQFFGTLNAERFALRLPESGINWRDGKLLAQLDGDTAQLAAFSLSGGKGIATASGKMSLQEATRQGALAVKFDHFGVLTRPDRNLVVSGEANLALQGVALSLTGKLKADEGRIERIKADAPVLGDDVVVMGRAEVGKRRTLVIPLTVRLDLDLGDKFVFKSDGVDARVSGLVRVAASPSQSFSASGALKVEEGKYLAYGQNLTITHGLVTFQGPLDNPALDVLAVRKNLPVEVGVKVSGTALAPRIAVTSDTAMGETEKLSWLVLGRSSASSGGEADLLLSAADALFSANDSAGIRQQVAGRLGLDDISIGRSDAYTTKTDANGNAEAGRVVSLGKRLSDRTYISYEQSLDGVGYAVRLTYQLSRRFSLALTAGKTSAADVLYSWTFD